jgi:hypothetical protein
MKRHGFPRMTPAIKGAKSVEQGVAWLQSLEIIVHPRCKHTIDELSTYAYVVDKDSGQPVPILEDKNNHVIDALRYAPGVILCQVEVDGITETESDKGVARSRKIIQRVDATEILRWFARDQALSVINLWGKCPPDVVLDYLMTGDEAARYAAWDAARAAAMAAAGDAARAAARAAGGATNEIQGARIMRDRGQPFFFLPLFGFATPEDIR